MKKMILLGALAVSFGTTAAQAQSVEELLGVSTPALQTPADPTMTGHAQAEESPFYARFTATPLVVGSINLQDAGSSGGNTRITNSKIKFDVGVGAGLTLGIRIPETYVFIEVFSGFQWAGVNQFRGTLGVGAAPGATFDLESNGGNLYQIPILLTPGLEFELPGQWPFLNGSSIRFGPSVGMMYYNLEVNNITAVGNPDVFDISGSGWVFTYGAMVALDLFIAHDMAITLGYQLQATSPIDYGQFNVDVGAAELADAKTNFTFTNVVTCGISIYF